MQIDVSQVEHKLALLAASQGLDVETFVAQSVRAMANEQIPDELLELTPEQMQESLRSIELGLEQAKADKGVPAKAALKRIAAELGLDFPR